MYKILFKFEMEFQYIISDSFKQIIETYTLRLPSGYNYFAIHSPIQKIAFDSDSMNRNIGNVRFFEYSLTSRYSYNWTCCSHVH